MSKLRIGIGGIWHESNSFCGRGVTAEDFTLRGRTAVGRNIVDNTQRRDEVAGFVQILGQHNQIEIVPLLSAETWIAGQLTDEAVEYLGTIIRRGLRDGGQLDGICFAPHGAISGVTNADVDGHFVKIFRDELGPHIPIVLALDCHAVVTRQMIDLSTALVGSRTHPHVDVVETGMRGAANILLDTLSGKVKPVTACYKIPLLIPPPDDGTNSGALKELFQKFIAWDQIDGVIAGSLCPSYAWQDVPEQGWAAVVVVDNDMALADRLARELPKPAGMLDFDCFPSLCFRLTRRFAGRLLRREVPYSLPTRPTPSAVAPPGDNTVLLAAVLDLCHEVNGLVLSHLPDPLAVSVVRAHRVGDTVTVQVGGKRDSRYSSPLTVTGQVLCITEGPIADDGNFIAEPMAEVGGIVCLGVNNIRLVLTDREIMGPQPSLFRKVGIEPFEAKVVTLKTGIGFKVTYGNVAKAVIRADCPGMVSYNLRNFDFTRIPRPMFPIDTDSDWTLPG